MSCFPDDASLLLEPPEVVCETTFPLESVTVVVIDPLAFTVVLVVSPLDDAAPLLNAPPEAPDAAVAVVDDDPERRFKAVDALLMLPIMDTLHLDGAQGRLKSLMPA